jgi:hypothetical protein
MLHRLLGKGRGTGFLLVKEEKMTIFPEHAKGREIEQGGEIRPCRFYDLFKI